MINGLKKIIPPSVIAYLRKALFNRGDEAPFTRFYYSQCGEDALLMQMHGAFNLPKNGFYIDVGAYHPMASSNTFKLYTAGWQGINIDPNPYSKVLFEKYRPLDKNLKCGISKVKGSLPYYILGETSTMNTFSKKNLEEFGMLQLVQKTELIETIPLSSVIQKFVPQNTSIDFLNVDAEGFEMEILESIDWNYKQPTIIALEQNQIFGFEAVLSTQAYSFLKQYNYQPVAMAMVTLDVATVFYAKRPVLKN